MALVNRIKRSLNIIWTGKDLEQNPDENHDPGEGQHAAPAVIRTELHLPETLVEEYRAEREKGKENETWKRRFEIAVVVIEIVGVILLFVTLRETRRATAAAVDAIGISRDALVEARKATEAAWKSAQADERSAQAAADQVVLTKEANQETSVLAENNLKTTIENARLDQRPWIFIVGAPLKIGEISKSSEFTGLPMKVANNGRTPAYIFETSHMCKTGPLPVIPRYEPRPENIIVPPGPTFTATPKFEGGLPENLVIDARMGKRSLYCYGYYKYRDWWGEEHATGYVFKFDRLTLGFSFDSTPQYVYAR